MMEWKRNTKPLELHTCSNLETRSLTLSPAIECSGRDTAVRLTATATALRLLRQFPCHLSALLFLANQLLLTVLPLPSGIKMTHWVLYFRIINQLYQNSAYPWVLGNVCYPQGNPEMLWETDCAVRNSLWYVFRSASVCGTRWLI